MDERRVVCPRCGRTVTADVNFRGREVIRTHWTQPPRRIDRDHFVAAGNVCGNSGKVAREADGA